MNIVIRDLNNLPQGWSVSIGNAYRNGNTFTWNNIRYGGELQLYYQDGSVNVRTATYFDISYTIVSANYNIGPYARIGGYTGYCVWDELAGTGLDQSLIGRDCNNAARTNIAGTKYVRGRVTGSPPLNRFAVTISTSQSGNYYYTGSIIINSIVIRDTSEPYELLDVPISTTGGGANSPSNPVGYNGIVNEAVDFPTVQSFSVSDAGFMSIWCPTLAQLQDLSYFLWNADPTTVEFWKRIVSSPLEMIYGLMIIPYNVPVEDLVENGDVYLGYQKSGIKMNYTTKQFVSVDCGSIDIKEVWGAFLDYSPYTKISIYLPYIGVHDLDADEIMNKTISLKYFIDLVTGSCVAIIKSGDSCLYTFNGNCAVQIPVTSAQHADAMKALLSIVGSSLQMAAVGGVAGAAAGAAIGGLTQMENLKPKISHSGNLSATTGYMAPQTPYLIFSRPKQAQPDKQQTYTGYPSFITSLIGDLKGYTEIEIIHLHNMTCTEQELAEIDRLLQEGVII